MTNVGGGPSVRAGTITRLVGGRLSGDRPEAPAGLDAGRCRRLILSLVGGALTIVGVIAPTDASGQSTSRRVDLFDRNSKRQGYAVIKPDGRVELYDRFSNRTGYGRISRDGTRIDLFDRNWQRTGHGTIREQRRER
jgi:hypothetical protein